MATARVVLATALVALPAPGCGRGGDESGAPVPVSLGGAINNHGMKAASRKMTVELHDFYFRPTFIRANRGQPVELELKNEGQAVHTFTSAELGQIDEQLAGGTSKKVTVTAPQRGHAVFVCRFHQRQGMQGAIFIE